jgi:hypothetical protein
MASEWVMSVVHAAFAEAIKGGDLSCLEVMADFFEAEVAKRVAQFNLPGAPMTAEEVEMIGKRFYDSPEKLEVHRRGEGAWEITGVGGNPSIALIHEARYLPPYTAPTPHVAAAAMSAYVEIPRLVGMLKYMMGPLSDAVAAGEMGGYAAGLKEGQRQTVEVLRDKLGDELNWEPCWPAIVAVLDSLQNKER